MNVNMMHYEFTDEYILNPYLDGHRILLRGYNVNLKQFAYYFCWAPAECFVEQMIRDEVDNAYEGMLPNPWFFNHGVWDEEGSNV